MTHGLLASIRRSVPQSLLSSESSQRTGDHAYAGQNEHVNECYQAEKITMRSRSLMYTV